MRRVLTAVGLAGLSACAPTLSANSYTASQVGSVNRAARGEVISARIVSVDRSTGVGGATGAGAGAIAGASLGSNTEGSLVGAIAGAVAGGIAGAALERGATKASAHEYVVRAENGALLTLVQGDAAIDVGAKVIVLYGSPARIILEGAGRK